MKNKVVENILIVAADFYPTNSPRSFRASELVRAFIRMGKKVSVLTNFTKAVYEEDTLKKAEYYFFDEDYPSLLLKGLDSAGKLGKKINEVLFEYPSIRYVSMVNSKLSRILKKMDIDLLISVASPHAIHWGVAKALKNKNIKTFTWIADCGDPFMGGKMNKIPKMPWFAVKEKQFCRECNFITVPMEAARLAYYPEFQKKIYVIPQGFNYEETQQYLEKYKPNPIPTFLYAGSLSPLRDIRPMLNYLTSLKDDFQFYIFTNSKRYIEDYLGDKRIRYSPFIKREDLIPIMGSMDFLVNVENMVIEQAPSKLIDYFLMKRPILNINQKILNTRKIDSFLNGNYEDQFLVSDPDQYKIENVAKKFLDLSEGSL